MNASVGSLSPVSTVFVASLVLVSCSFVDGLKWISSFSVCSHRCPSLSAITLFLFL